MSRPAKVVAAAAFLLALPAVAAAQTPDAPCSVLSRTAGRYARTPLVGFDPATAPAPISIPTPGGSRALVLCHRATVVPEPGDYRVPAEAHLPLALTDEREVLQLDIVGGRLQADFRRGQPTADEAAAVKVRVEQMQAAMAAAAPAR